MDHCCYTKYVQIFGGVDGKQARRTNSSGLCSNCRSMCMLPTCITQVLVVQEKVEKSHETGVWKFSTGVFDELDFDITCYIGLLRDFQLCGTSSVTKFEKTRVDLNGVDNYRHNNLCQIRTKIIDQD
ncbi:Uncharacterized protein Fot_28709 [Forsythia ovata]|uniref:Uncharacterized protein n=1 Tax=Forsythia ovata TaxID=205694 RepID=A0ABD1TPS9_9LAMI